MLEKEVLNMLMPSLRTFGAMIGFGFGISHPLNGNERNRFLTGMITAGICTRYPALSIFPLFCDKQF